MIPRWVVRIRSPCIRRSSRSGEPGARQPHARPAFRCLPAGGDGFGVDHDVGLLVWWVVVGGVGFGEAGVGPAGDGDAAAGGETGVVTDEGALAEGQVRVPGAFGDPAGAERAAVVG